MTTNTFSVLTTLAVDTATRLRAQLTTAISDETQATNVVNGVLRGYEKQHAIKVMVRKGDETWRNTFNVSSQNVGMTAPVGEVGGTLYWRRRFTIDIDIRFDASVSQFDATQIADIVLSRAEWALQNHETENTWWFSLEEDSFGEHASRIMVLDSYMVESGSLKAWRWSGQIKLEFLTEKPGCV